MRQLAFITLALLVIDSTPATAGTFYKYTDLVLRNYDEMRKAVQKKIDKAQSLANSGPDEEVDLDAMPADDEESPSGASPEPTPEEREAIEILRDAVKLVLSRPNKDNMVEKLMPPLRRELTGYSAYEDTLSSLATEAVNGAKQDKIKPVYRATYIVMLENILSEIRPEMGKPDYEAIIAKIRDAKIKVADDVKSEMRLRAMMVAPNPSDLADQILKDLAKKRKDEAKKAKDEKSKKK